jgi:phosphoribosylformimino-5-aminoimidazole carboxamide ribotide isomerase
LKIALKVVPIKSLEEVLRENRELFGKWIAEYGADILGQMRIMKSSCFWMVRNSNEDLIPFYSRQNKGIQYVICTDIAKDGMLEGPSFDLYAKKILAEAKGIKLIASGGISLLMNYQITELG